MNVINRVKTFFLDGQYGHPSGVTGRWLGEKMVREHVPETTWTLTLMDLQPEDTVLELGFGAGKAIEQVAASTYKGQVAGIDISPTMVRSASRRNSSAIKSGRVELHCGDLTNLPFSPDRFDKVFTIQTLYFWPDIPHALAEIFRVLKPGGLLVITLSTGQIDTKEATGLEHYQQILEQQVLPEMQRLGFNEVVIKQGPASRQFKTTAVLGRK